MPFLNLWSNFFHLSHKVSTLNCQITLVCFSIHSSVYHSKYSTNFAVCNYNISQIKRIIEDIIAKRLGNIHVIQIAQRCHLKLSIRFKNISHDYVYKTFSNVLMRKDFIKICYTNFRIGWYENYSIICSETNICQICVGWLHGATWLYTSIHVIFVKCL